MAKGESRGSKRHEGKEKGAAVSGKGLRMTENSDKMSNLSNCGP